MARTDEDRDPVAPRKRGSTHSPTYDTSIALGDEGARALRTSLVVLAAAGFRVAGRTASSAELTATPAVGCTCFRGAGWWRWDCLWGWWSRWPSTASWPPMPGPPRWPPCWAR